MAARQQVSAHKAAAESMAVPSAETRICHHSPIDLVQAGVGQGAIIVAQAQKKEVQGSMAAGEETRHAARGKSQPRGSRQDGARQACCNFMRRRQEWQTAYSAAARRYPAVPAASGAVSRVSQQWLARQRWCCWRGIPDLWHPVGRYRQQCKQCTVIPGPAGNVPEGGAGMYAAGPHAAEAWQE